MKRTRSVAVSRLSAEAGNLDAFESYRRDNHDEGSSNLQQEHSYPRDEIIIRNIASFMTLSDAASLTSAWTSEMDLQNSTNNQHAGVATPTDSWAVGIELQSDALFDISTPVTPALVALSPSCDEGNEEGLLYESSMEPEERRRRWAQEKLTNAVLSHPLPLRSYCLEAYNAAQKIREEQKTAQSSPETLVEPQTAAGGSSRKASLQFIHELVDLVFHNVPLSVLLDFIEATTSLSLDATFSSFRLTGKAINAILSGLANFVGAIWDAITNFNPFQLLEAIITLQFDAMGKTSEALASGLQSVATGVGSASSIALNRFSGANLSSVVSASSHGVSVLNTKRSTMDVNQKLLKKLSTINDAARVVAYEEYEDDTGGLTRKAISRTRRMMHYTVSLRPFVATVSVKGTGDESPPIVGHPSDSEGSDSERGGSPFMCTPQSFPPTPHSRHFVMMQKSRFSDDDVFAARDRLRLHGALSSNDERTREMAAALKDNQILAVFDDRDDRESDVELRCGKHVATKIGNMYYSTARGRVPILRNCYVYFEISVLPHSGMPAVTIPSLSIGLSTEEMPPNTLVGAWQGSVGLCTTGQILAAGQWCSPPDPTSSCYSVGSTVGVLVHVDDDTAFDTWDGVMITASVTFSIEGRIVLPAVFPPSQADLRPGKVPTTNSQQPREASFTGPAPTVKVLVPAAEDVFPTVTLQSVATSVMCLFSSEDILATSRAMIGAPDNGKAIYAVDGSVLNIS